MLFAAARYAECICACDQRDDFEHASLAASAALRRRHYADAIARGSALRAVCRDAGQDAKIAGVLALSYAALQRYESAAEILETIREYDLSPSARLQYTYDRAAVAWARGDNASADLLLRSCDYSRHPAEKAHADFLRSWILAKEHRYVEQAVLLRNTIRALCSADVPDVGTIARALHALSVTCREVHVPAASHLLQSLPRTLAWTDDIAYEHFHTLRNVGWHHALHGDYIPAIRHLDLAKRLASSAYWLLMSHLDHAQIAKVAGEDFTMQAQMEQAAEIIDDLADDPTGDEALSLVVAAEVFAERDNARSLIALGRFAALHKRMRASFALARDERTEGMYRYAAAIVAECGGRAKHAVEHAEQALNIFERLGFEWRAARCALLLHRCTGERRYLESARELARCYSRGFLREAVDAQEGSSPCGLGALTWRQREVFELLVQGFTVNEAAERLCLSPNTVKVHKNRIYAMLRVRNRLELSQVRQRGD